MAKKFPKLTLGKLLPHIDSFHWVKIIDAIEHGEVIFEGVVTDVPWTCLNMVLDTGSGGEAISCDTIINEYGVTLGRIIICVGDDDDD